MSHKVGNEPSREADKGFHLLRLTYSNNNNNYSLLDLNKILSNRPLLANSKGYSRRAKEGK